MSGGVYGAEQTLTRAEVLKGRGMAGANGSNHRPEAEELADEQPGVDPEPTARPEPATCALPGCDEPLPAGRRRYCSAATPPRPSAGGATPAAGPQSRSSGSRPLPAPTAPVLACLRWPPRWWPPAPPKWRWWSTGPPWWPGAAGRATFRRAPSPGPGPAGAPRARRPAVQA